MEAFPVGSAHHTAQHTPGPMAGGVRPSGNSATVGIGGPPLYAPGPGQSQPMSPHTGGMTGAPLAQSGMYDPASSSVVNVPKKSKTGMIVALLILLAAGGGIAAVVVLGSKDKKADLNAAGSGSAEVVADTGSAGGTTPDQGSAAIVPDKGSAAVVPVPDKGSAAVVDTGSAGATDQGSAANSGSAGGTVPTTDGSGGGSASTVVDSPKTTTVFLVTNAVVFDVYEGDKKLMTGPDAIEVVPGVPRKLTLKAAGYKPATVTVDGKTKKVMTKLARDRTATTTTNTGGHTTTPAKQDCTHKILDAGSEACRKQYCGAHKNDPRCATLDDD